MDYEPGKVRIEDRQVRTVLASFVDQKKEHRFVSATEWINGEGFDIEIDGKYTLTISEDEAIALHKALGAHLEE